MKSMPGVSERLRNRLIASAKWVAILIAAGGLAATALSPASAMAATTPTATQSPAPVATKTPAPAAPKAPAPAPTGSRYAAQPGLYQVFYFYGSDGKLHYYWQMVRQPNQRLGYWVQYWYPNSPLPKEVWYAWGTGPAF